MITTDIDIEINNEFLFFEKEGKEYKFSIKEISSRLFKATLSEKQNFIVSPSGYGIHWPMVDEDLSIEGLIKTVK
ncbi:MAG: DUF2442 domain-containing protein [Chitinophagales bacterium]|nr:DUF2442 domain-containing protein [Chitinophagales bacterium]